MKNILLLAGVLCVLGCAKHENFPAPLDIKVPPVVTDLAISRPDSVKFDLTWNIDADAVDDVDHYNVYTLGAFGSFDLAGTSPTPTFGAATTFPVEYLIFGVTVVTKENVEGDLVFAASPRWP